MTGNNGEKTGRDTNGRFTPDNPGRPRGARHKATQAAETLLQGEADAITRKAVELAMSGDTVALRLCLERICPPRKDAPLVIDLPEVSEAGDLPGAVSAILRAVGEGRISPSEAERLTRLVGQAASALEVHELEQRIERLEVERDQA